jgi:hypothetical protein
VDALALIVVVLVVIAGFKLLGLVLKAGLFILGIPLMILGAVTLTALVIAVVPLTLVGGLFAAVLAPIALLVPLLPLVLIGLGIALLAKKR